MISEKESVYKVTKYPEIYKNTYWGLGHIESIENEIIDNRNKFIEEYNIKNIKKFRSKKFRSNLRENHTNRIFDHMEYYETNDKKYYEIISPYFEDNNEAQKYGFKKLYPLYNSSATTYIRELMYPYKN